MMLRKGYSISTGSRWIDNLPFRGVGEESFNCLADDKVRLEVVDVTLAVFWGPDEKELFEMVLAPPS